jgi:hypothetical protein
LVHKFILFTFQSLKLRDVRESGLKRHMRDKTIG